MRVGLRGEKQDFQASGTNVTIAPSHRLSTLSFPLLLRSSSITATMSQIGFIPPPHYVPDKLFTFEEPENTEWTIIDKLEQENFQQDEEDFSYGYVPSFACAIFLVRNSVNDQEAFMRVYQQIPIKGTEFSSPEERAQQAVSSFHGEFEAMKAFHEKESTITPALLGYKEESQDTQGIVPGGYVIQFVFERVPGVPLAEDRILPGFGAPLHSFFQKAESERIEIRKQFDEGYRKLQELGWEPAYPWANNLIWDASSTKL